jgi:hypothetical protein
LYDLLKLQITSLALNVTKTSSKKLFHFVNESNFGRKDILSIWHFSNMAFCQNDILSTWQTFCQHDNWRDWHFFNMTLCQNDILPTWLSVNMIFLSTWHFINMTLCQNDILPTWHSVYMTFCQNDILSKWYFITLSFRQNGILSTWHFVKMTFVSNWHFVKMTFHQLTIVFEREKVAKLTHSLWTSLFRWWGRSWVSWLLRGC